MKFKLQLLKKLSVCENVVDIIAFHIRKINSYILMTCAVTDFHYLVTKSRCSEHQLRDAFRDILLGVKQMHDRQIVHLDLKNENILVLDSGRCVIADLGIAVQLSKNQKLSHYSGTRGVCYSIFIVFYFLTTVFLFFLLPHSMWLLKSCCMKSV